VVSIIYYQIAKEQRAGATYRTLSESRSIELLTFVQEYLLKYFGKIDVTLCEYQNLVGGDNTIALSGIPDVTASCTQVRMKWPYKLSVRAKWLNESCEIVFKIRLLLLRFTKASGRGKSIC